MRNPTPFQSQMLAKAREDARLARKKSYGRVVGLAIGGAGVASAMAGMPMSMSFALWGVGGLAWMILKRA